MGIESDRKCLSDSLAIDEARHVREFSIGCRGSLCPTKGGLSTDRRATSETRLLATAKSYHPIDQEGQEP